MSTPIFKLWMAKPTLEVALMPQERIAELMQSNQQNMQQLGIRELISGSLWSSEQRTMFGVEWNPDWKAVRDHVRCLDEMHWFQYLESNVYLGVAEEGTPADLQSLDFTITPDSIIHIYLARMTQAMYAIDQETMARGLQVQQQIREMGVRDVMRVHSRATNEEWDSWGVECIPDMETLLQKTALQEKVQWGKYIQAKTFLATADDGELLKK